MSDSSDGNVSAGRSREGSPTRMSLEASPNRSREGSPDQRVEDRYFQATRFGKVRVLGVWVEREFKLPWREAGPPNHHDDAVGSDQWVGVPVATLEVTQGVS